MGQRAPWYRRVGSELSACGIAAARLRPQSSTSNETTLGNSYCTVPVFLTWRILPARRITTYFAVVEADGSLAARACGGKHVIS